MTNRWTKLRTVLVHLSTLGSTNPASTGQFVRTSVREVCQSIRLLLYKVEWSQHGWKYEINTCNTNIIVLGSELIGTDNLQLGAIAKPVFRLGELVEFRFHGDGPPIRIVQGIQLINDCWLYSIEWMSPAISEKGDEVFTSRDFIARVSDYDLERVRL